eukprot:1258932-Lingulodinium_polyedra.AAC.1
MPQSVRGKGIRALRPTLIIYVLAQLPLEAVLPTELPDVLLEPHPASGSRCPPPAQGCGHTGPRRGRNSTTAATQRGTATTCAET